MPANAKRMESFFATEQHIQKKGTFKRFGLVDGVILYWTKVPQDLIDANPEYWQRAFASNQLCFFRDGYMLKVRKIRTAHTWLAQKEKTKETDKAPADFLADADGDVIGTMNHDMFLNEWYKPKVLDIFKLVKRAKDRDELFEMWPGSGANSAMAEDDIADINELVPLLGRDMTTIADGAGYHKNGHPKYVKRCGAKSLFGVDEKGRVLEEYGWTKETCIVWLWAKDNIPNCRTIKQMLKYMETAPPDMQTTYKTYTDKTVIELRELLDKLAVRLRYQVVKATLEVGVVWTEAGVDKCEEFSLEDPPEAGSTVTDEQLENFAVKEHDILDLVGEGILGGGFKFLWTPPCIGKWLNIIEELWHLVKSRARVSIPIPDRNKDSEVKAGLYRELVSACTKHRQLQNTLLNSMRFCFAVVKATFH